MVNFDFKALALGVFLEFKALALECLNLKVWSPKLNANLEPVPVHHSPHLCL
jgi:hypothetical protein